MSEKNPKHTSTHRSPEEKRALLNRLSRLEGQLRAVRGMVERDEYCNDILNLVVAIERGVRSFGTSLLSSHFRSCVLRDIQEGDTEIIDEFLTTMAKFMK